ncbi:MAG: putative hydrolase of the superfamily [Frankiaceae bacterium]|nr:putative hydrolase of the superfamily [Frankiaceae bacterium]
MPELTALVVDFGGVLTTSMRESFTEFVKAEDVDGEHLHTVLFGDYGEGTLVHGVETGAVTMEEFERELAARLKTTSGDPVAAEGLVRRMFAGAGADGRMLGAVRKARESGLRTALLSNSWGNRDSYAFEHFDTLFDAVVISGEVGMRKPDPGIYALAAREVGVPPEQCVFVDDIAANVRGAVAAGMVGVHHTDTAATLLELETLFGVALG